MSMCIRCAFLPAAHGALCCHCHTLTTMVRELLEHGLTVRDVALRLNIHDKTAAAVVAEIGRIEH